MNVKQVDSWEDLASAPAFIRAWQVGARLCVAFAPFSLIILLLLLLGGPEQVSRGTLIRMDLLLLTYPAGAFVAGAMLGVLLPITRYLLGAIISGLLAVIPWAAGISLAFDHGYARWTTGHSVVTFATAAILGGSYGFAFHRAVNSPRPRRRMPRTHRDHAA